MLQIKHVTIDENKVEVLSNHIPFHHKRKMANLKIL